VHGQGHRGSLRSFLAEMDTLTEEWEFGKDNDGLDMKSPPDYVFENGFMQGALMQFWKIDRFYTNHSCTYSLDLLAYDNFARAACSRLLPPG
jgi:hypothetical protein